MDFNLRYKDASQRNSKLKEELKRLEGIKYSCFFLLQLIELFSDENARVYSPWSCEVCTFFNEPYVKTRRDVCEMCEGPSPLKRRKKSSSIFFLNSSNFLLDTLTS
jgi:hypothetical protein